MAKKDQTAMAFFGLTVVGAAAFTWWLHSKVKTPAAQALAQKKAAEAEAAKKRAEAAAHDAYATKVLASIQADVARQEAAKAVQAKAEADQAQAIDQYIKDTMPFLPEG